MYQHQAIESQLIEALRAQFQDELRQIMTLQVERMRRRLGERKLQLQFGDKAARWLAAAGHADPIYGPSPSSEESHPERTRNAYCQR